jgi:hypothetical protein
LQRRIKDRLEFSLVGKIVADDSIAAGIAFTRLVANGDEATARLLNEALALMDII